MKAKGTLRNTVVNYILLVMYFQGVSCEPGEVVFGCVLDWDFDKKLVNVSLNPELVAQRKAAGSPKTKQKKVSTLNFVTFSLNVLAFVAVYRIC